WIITGIEGEYYPCKPSVFEATYDLVEQTTETGGNATSPSPAQ
ncbi:hypothetical protein LCGC14_2579340, partial [marine sediment metagenome]